MALEPAIVVMVSIAAILAAAVRLRVIAQMLVAAVALDSRAFWIGLACHCRGVPVVPRVQLA